MGFSFCFFQALKGFSGLIGFSGFIRSTGLSGCFVSS